MVVPLPARRQHQIERSHHRFFAIDRGEGAFALHNESQRALGVAMTGGDFAGQDELQAGVKAGCGRGGSRQAGVFHDQHPAFGLRRADQVAGAQQVVAGVGIGPAMDLRR